MSYFHSAPSNWIVCKVSSKSDKILVLRLFLPYFWFQWSLNDLFKPLKWSVNFFSLLLTSHFWLLNLSWMLHSRYFWLRNCYYWLLLVTSRYVSLLLPPRFSNNVCVVLDMFRHQNNKKCCSFVDLRKFCRTQSAYEHNVIIMAIITINIKLIFCWNLLSAF